MSFTNYLEDAVLDHVFGGNAYLRLARFTLASLQRPRQTRAAALRYRAADTRARLPHSR